MILSPATVLDKGGMSINLQTLTASANGTGVDCLGYDYAVIVHLFGTVSASNTATFTVQQSSDDGSTDAYAAVSGAVYTCTGTEDNTPVLGWVRLNGKDRYLRVAYAETATGQSTAVAVAILRYKMQDYPLDASSSPFAYGVL